MLKNRNDLFEALGIRKEDTLCLVLKSFCMNEEEVKDTLTFFPGNTKDAIINFINKEVTNYG